MSTATPTAPAVAATGRDGFTEAVTGLVEVLHGLGREDLVTRATAANARLRRPSTIVCVVGEFKQGKSSLVNGLLGADVCPVDDDLATSAITLVRHGETTGAVVRRRDGDQAVAERVEIDRLGDWISEQGNPANQKQVERVEITSISSILRQGLALVDTPGMGGLGAGHAAATLSFLPFADGLILTSDASAELSAPEVALLRQAVELCPTVLFVQTKIDLYPAWERILDLNRGHLARAGLDVPVVAVSSTLRREALARKDRSLNEASHFPELVASLGTSVVEPAKALAEERSRTDVRHIAQLVDSALTEERKLLADPSKLGPVLADLEAATERLAHLRGPGARWALVVGDRVSDLTNDVTFGMRSGMRTISRALDERVETLRTAQEWDDMVRDLQTMVADEVTRAFVAVEAGRAEIREEVAALLEDEHLALPTALGRPVDAIDLSSMWQGKALEEGTRTKRAFGTGLTGLRGAQGGVVMFGMMGSFLPAAAATLIASNPVMLGAGAVLGGLQISEERKRKVAVKRQGARQQVRQFIDDVQFQVTNELTGAIRELQRAMRDEFGARLAELQRTCTETAQRAQQDAKRTQEESRARAAEIDTARTALARVTKLVGPGGAR